MGAALHRALLILERDEIRRRQMRAKGEALVRRHADGMPWDEVLLDEEPPPMTTLLAESARAIGEASSIMRRAEAHLLYRSGLSMEKIGHRLGVSRQRVAVLLGSSEASRAQADPPKDESD